MKYFLSMSGLTFILLMLAMCTGIKENDSKISNPSFTETPYPRIAMLWRAVRGQEGLESVAKHDLIMVGEGFMGLIPNQEPAGLAEAYTEESLETARERIRRIRELNPDALIIADLLFYEYRDNMLPEAHPWWLREDGERVQFWPGTHRMDWYNKEYRQKVIKQTLSLKTSGADGVFYDNLRNEPEPWVSFLQELREAIGNDFLVLINAGYDVGSYNFAYPFINGIMYESGWSHKRFQWDETIRQMQYSQSLLLEPKISLIERFEETDNGAGWPADENRGKKPPADPAARRWSFCFSLTIGDFYYLFSDNTSHAHDWYPEYDIKIGLPVKEGIRINPYVWTREYEKAMVVVNLPGADEDYIIETGQKAVDAFSGDEGTRFIIPPGDGRILVLN